jgi:N utilization substance protein A
MSREILLLVDVLAREKNVTRDIVFGALEMALASATKKRIHDDANVRVAVDRETGDFETFRRWEVVADEDFLDEEQQVPLSEAQVQDPEVEIGDCLEESLEPIDFRAHRRAGGQAGDSAKDSRRRARTDSQRFPGTQGASGDWNDQAHGARQCDCRNRQDGGLLPRDQMIPRENLRVGDRVKAYLLRIDRPPAVRN